MSVPYLPLQVYGHAGSAIQRPSGDQDPGPIQLTSPIRTPDGRGSEPVGSPDRSSRTIERSASSNTAISLESGDHENALPTPTLGMACDPRTSPSGRATTSAPDG